jgi:hypothetical protein
MKTQTILSFIVTALIALFAVSTVMAATGSLPVTISDAEVNDVVLTEGVNTLAGAPGETIPVIVTLEAGANISDVKVRVYIEGYKSDIYASTSRFDVIEGSTYIKKLALTLPSVEDMNDVTEGLTLRVRVSDKSDEKEYSYDIRMQREAYSLQFLNVDAPAKASAGEILPIDVVLENSGLRDAENNFVTVSIPELGVSKKAYFGDLVVVDNTDANDNEDARERRIYLILPSDVKSGEYTLQVSASNYDVTSTVKKVISITGSAAADDKDENTNVITPGKTNDKAGLPTSVIVLTVVLVIIFVVLLVVLIVLLTKKPSDKVEDFGETSYY